MKKMKTLSRVLITLLCAAILVCSIATLTSCGDNSKDYNMTKSEISDYADATDKTAEARKYVARILALDSSFREKFTAAYRGYDMTAPDFNDETVTTDTKTTNVDAAKAVLDLVIAKIPKDESKTVVTTYKEALTAEEVGHVITRMKTLVETDGKAGVIDTVLIWVGKFLSWMTDLTGGFYAVSIFLFALLMKIIFIPAGIKQQKTQIAQAKLRPKIAQIEKKYAGRNDQATLQKKQQEIMELQQKEGAGCVSGCLPLLIQFPIIIALYNIITNPLRYVLGVATEVSTALTTYVTTAKAAGGLGITLTSKSTIEMLSAIRGMDISGMDISGIKDFLYFGNSNEIFNTLSEPLKNIPKFYLGKLDLGLTPSIKQISLLVLIPIVATFFQWLTMVLNKKWNGTNGMAQGSDAQTAASMKMMDLMFPAMTLFISFTLPAMLGLYWIYQSVLALGQTYVLSKLMPLPTYTAQELREMEKAQKEKEKAMRQQAQAQPRHKSLHYIDEDDYDVLPELQGTKKDDKKGPLGLDAGSLKDDRKD